jgi:hypothetical protein
LGASSPAEIAADKRFNGEFFLFSSIGVFRITVKRILGTLSRWKLHVKIIRMKITLAAPAFGAVANAPSNGEPP